MIICLTEPRVHRSTGLARHEPAWSRLRERSIAWVVMVTRFNCQKKHTHEEAEEQLPSQIRAD